MNDYAFGNFICSLREERGMTQSELATQLGITAAAISKWENGESKPRVDMLYRLSQQLGVSVEELLAGRKFDERDSLDSEAVRRIREQYDYLRRTESHSSAVVKVSRISAYIIDAIILGFISALFFGAVVLAYYHGVIGEVFMAFGVIIAYFSWPVFMVLRDLIGGGRSLGKRIMGLTVIDRYTAKRPRLWQLLVRCLFLLIQEPDLIIMLVRGLSIGDSAARTLVVSKKEAGALYSMSTDDINSYGIGKGSRRVGRRVSALIGVLASAVVLVTVVCVLAVVFSLEAVKSNPEYKVAYNYLLESEAYERAGGDISLRAYEIGTSFSDIGVSATHGIMPVATARFTFDVGSYTADVICHRSGDGTWYACRVCTTFD